MKKLLAILAVALMMVPAISMAAQMDLSALSTDDLFALSTRIVGELLSRTEIKGIDVPEGVYIVGKDIPAGEYRIEEADGNYGLYIEIYPDIETQKRLSSEAGTSSVLEHIRIVQTYTISKESPIGRVVLEEGNVFKSLAHVILRPYTGLVIIK